MAEDCKDCPLRELIDSRFDAEASARKGVQEVIETRLAAMDKAVRLMQDRADRTPDFIAATVKAAVDVVNERFVHTDAQFAERIKGVMSALQAQKEAASEVQRSSTVAIAKSEASTARTIEQLQTLFQAGLKSLEDKVGALTSRLDLGEGSHVGSKATSQASRENIGVIIGLATLVLAIVGFALVHLVK